MPVYFTLPLSQLTSKWRIFYEESVDLNPRDERTDFEELRGYDDTRIYRHGQDTLAVSTDNSRLQTRLRRILGLVPKTGPVLLFPDTLLDMVAEVIRARYRHQYTPEQREVMQGRMLEARKSLIQPRHTALKLIETRSVGNSLKEPLLEQKYTEIEEVTHGPL